MNGRIARLLNRWVVAGMLLALAAGAPLRAHCDTLDGPVVQDAQRALQAGDVTGVLKWVQAADEAAIREAFQHTMAVRALSPAARELADRYFFETLVRIHRAGEGAAYTGLKPAGTSVDPGITVADQAVEHGSADALIRAMTSHVADGLRERFAAVVEARRHRDESVAAGRAYVAAYVTFIHYVERLHQAAISSPAHGAAPAEPGEHIHQH